MVSIDSKLGKLKEFYEVLSDFKNLKPVTIEIKTCKNRIMNNANQLYNKYLHTYKKKYDSQYFNKEDKNFFDQFKIIGRKKQKPKSTEENIETGRDAKAKVNRRKY